MATFEVETDLIVHCKIKVVVDAGDKAEAINAVADLMPNNFDSDSRIGWKATVSVKPPKGVNMRVVKAYHFEQASGADKARKVS